MSIVCILKELLRRVVSILQLKPHIKNTTRMKANAMGFYPIVGEGVISFPENSKIESFNEFLRAIRAVNNDYKAIIVVLTILA